MEKTTEQRPAKRAHPLDVAMRVIRKSQSSRRRRELEQNLVERWPDESWSLPKERGWIALPKDVPLLMAILDELADGKTARTYLALFALTWEGVPMATIRDEDETALWAGFHGQRRRYGLRNALESLKTLGFIRVIGPPGGIRDILLRKPKDVVADLRATGALSPESSPAYRFFDHVQAYRRM